MCWIKERREGQNAIYLPSKIDFQPVLRKTGIEVRNKAYILTLKKMLDLFNVSVYVCMFMQRYPCEFARDTHVEVREKLICSPLIPGRNEFYPRGLAASAFNHRAI